MREAGSEALWDVVWVDDTGTMIGAWRRLDREIAQHVAQRWLATRPQSQVILFRRRSLAWGEEILELVQVLRPD